MGLPEFGSDEEHSGWSGAPRGKSWRSWECWWCGPCAEALIAHARAQSGVSQLELTVISHNTAALALYRRFGFTRFGHQEDALRWNGQRFAEDHLALIL